MLWDSLAERLRIFKAHSVYVLRSSIVGVQIDQPDTFPATAALAKKAADVRSVCNDDAVSGNCGLRPLGKEHGRQRRPYQPRTNYALLADTRSPAPQALHATSVDVRRRDPASHTMGFRLVLQPLRDPEAYGFCQIKGREQRIHNVKGHSRAWRPVSRITNWLRKTPRP
jgi:hypothetical protein